MIEARDLRVTLARREILRGADIIARAGEVTCIVGPNGSGKTTLLRALTGEIKAEGEIRLDGQPLDRLSPTDLATRRAVLPQAARIAFPFTVLEVVRLGLLASPEPDEALPAAALAAVGLAGFEGRFYHALSGGEQQRCQLARVLVQGWEPVVAGRPRWLFLDEPVAALDIGHQLAVMRIAEDYAARGGGVVAVMHDLNLTAMFARSVALVEAGRITAQGSASEVLTTERLSRAYGCHLPVGAVPEGGDRPFLLPHGARPPRAV
ncbi:heme ABC transporter ATP-binding protein [Poseidonocella sedimentorum]|uniref:Iron complex transport system ATP-binding protein n=1 Tax=Poseidonocella sedimentorum TaxID=871652 RepID=A0A1I6E4T9_9RHOB|nr:heme ABC transporter ATP-binding protein [Poseidonocella sedimentorum]SFR12716.1 iron complex transport system ATP-binding protein [Poseidonocella sedimentorum]